MPKPMSMYALPFSCLLALASISIAHAGPVTVTNLVTDKQAANPAKITDTQLHNAWGLSSSPTSPFWVSSNGDGVSTLYSVNPVTQATTKLGLTVAIPGDGSVTGQVFNPAGGFNNDAFLFVSEDGTISGWRGALGTTAEVLQLPGSASYKGAALGLIGGNHYLYAADFAGGKIDVIKGTSGAPDLAGSFTDPALPSGYAPFNIQNIGNTLYVAYAVVGSDGDEVAGAGLGFVDSFDLSGNMLGRIASGGALNAPWGLAIAPTGFGDMAGNLLVGNFGDGRISRYDPATGTFLGQLQTAGGSVLSIEGLWALGVGNGGSGGSASNIYFTAGPDGETHGLFGVLAASVPEVQTWAMMIIGLGAIGATMRRRTSALSAI